LAIGRRLNAAALLPGLLRSRFNDISNRDEFTMQNGVYQDDRFAFPESDH
jgi:hypothetical protein